MNKQYGRKGGSPSQFRTSQSCCGDVRKWRAWLTLAAYVYGRSRRSVRRARQQEIAMAKVDHAARKRYVYKKVDCPVGRLTLVASDEGLAAILWENDRPRRVRLNIEGEDDRHPVLVET